MNLDRKGGWDKDWVVLWVFFLFYSFHFIKQVFHICMYMSMYEYSYFDYIVFHIHIEKEKKVHTKKEISGKSQNFIELLASARPPPELKFCQS